MRPSGLSLCALCVLALCSTIVVGCRRRAAPPMSAYDAAYHRCMRAGGFTPQTCTAYAQHRAGPQNEVVLDERGWAALEAQARGTTGATDAPVTRIQDHGFSAEQYIDLAGGRCYTLGVAWASGRPTRATVGFLQNPDGSWPNAQVQRRSFHLSPPAGKVEFCIDNPGRALLSLTATEGGVMVQNASFQYVVASIDRAETAEDRARRQEEERAELAADRAQIEHNLQMSDHRRGGAAFARVCARCREQYYRCLDDEDDEDEECVLSLETCAQAAGTDERGRVLCARP